VSLPAGALSITFGDVDADGNVDLVVPVCFPAATCYEEFSVHIIFNKQRAMCKTRDTSFFDSCRSERKLCSASPFSFDAVVGDGHSVLALKPPSNANPDFVVKSPYVPRVMLGDLDLDGFADMIFAHSGEVHFMRNVRSTVRHSFEESSFDSKLSKEILSAMTDVVAATFIDLDESGMLDVMLVRGNPDSSSNYITETYVNNLFLDAFFLKTVGLNGICPAWCSDGPTFPDPKPYGVNMVGVTTKFVVTELDGSVSTATGVQLPQLGGNNLASPYAYFGLGRTNNYLEYFYMGFSNGETREWNGLIPNSQVIALPYPPNSPDDWELELFISPSAVIVWVVFTLGIGLLILGAQAAWFRYREHKEDKAEKQRTAHVFSFD
jgi:integrin alpha FG-GAP repeat containing protein 1